MTAKIQNQLLHKGTDKKANNAKCKNSIATKVANAKVEEAKLLAFHIKNNPAA